MQRWLQKLHRKCNFSVYFYVDGLKCLRLAGALKCLRFRQKMQVFCRKLKFSEVPRVDGSNCSNIEGFCTENVTFLFSSYAECCILYRKCTNCLIVLAQKPCRNAVFSSENAPKTQLFWLKNTRKLHKMEGIPATGISVREQNGCLSYCCRRERFLQTVTKEVLPNG